MKPKIVIGKASDNGGNPYCMKPKIVIGKARDNGGQSYIRPVLYKTQDQSYIRHKTSLI